MDIEFQNINDLTNGMDVQNPENLNEVHEHANLGVLTPLAGYAAMRISKMPAVRDFINERINDCKEALSNTFESSTDAVKEFGTKVYEGVKDFCCGVYDNVKEFFTGKEKANLSETQFPASAHLNESAVEARGFENREFGLDECTEAAKEIFNNGVISEWGNLSTEERRGIALMYADRVAEAFQLAEYRGVFIEKMEPGTLGSNNGDGTIHLSDVLLDGRLTPFEIMDTITHELRHQYQNECIRGYHNVPDEVRNEWAVADKIYNYDQPSCYDPWGYKYNPLEIDSNYAGNTVVRNVSSQIFNDALKGA